MQLIQFKDSVPFFEHLVPLTLMPLPTAFSHYDLSRCFQCSLILLTTVQKKLLEVAAAGNPVIFMILIYKQGLRNIKKLAQKSSYITSSNVDRNAYFLQNIFFSKYVKQYILDKETLSSSI